MRQRWKWSGCACGSRLRVAVDIFSNSVPG
jgi:hypothetical protein